VALQKGEDSTPWFENKRGNADPPAKGSEFKWPVGSKKGKLKKKKKGKHEKKVRGGERYRFAKPQ